MPGKRKHEGSVERPLEDKADIGGNNKAAGEKISVLAFASGPLAQIKPRICVPYLLPAIPSGLGGCMQQKQYQVSTVLVLCCRR